MEEGLAGRRGLAKVDWQVSGLQPVRSRFFPPPRAA